MAESGLLIGHRNSPDFYLDCKDEVIKSGDPYVVEVLEKGLNEFNGESFFLHLKDMVLERHQMMLGSRQASSVYRPLVIATLPESAVIEVALREIKRLINIAKKVEVDVGRNKKEKVFEILYKKNW